MKFDLSSHEGLSPNFMPEIQKHKQCKDTKANDNIYTHKKPSRHAVISSNVQCSTILVECFSCFPPSVV